MKRILFKISFIVMFVCIFLVGWLSHGMFNNIQGFEQPLGNFFNPKDVISPSNHIAKDQIHVYDDRIIIDLKNAQWAEFTDTNSMDPVLDAEANSFEIVPTSEDQINKGDIISYKPESFNGLIVHRVIETGKDDDGWYAITKGDNLTQEDPELVRFDQISGLLVGIIY